MTLAACLALVVVLAPLFALVVADAVLSALTDSDGDETPLPVAPSHRDGMVDDGPFDLFL